MVHHGPAILTSATHKTRRYNASSRTGAETQYDPRAGRICSGGVAGIGMRMPMIQRRKPATIQNPPTAAPMPRVTFTQ